MGKCNVQSSANGSSASTVPLAQQDDSIRVNRGTAVLHYHELIDGKYVSKSEPFDGYNFNVKMRWFPFRSDFLQDNSGKPVQPYGVDMSALFVATSKAGYYRIKGIRKSGPKVDIEAMSFDDYCAHLQKSANTSNPSAPATDNSHVVPEGNIPL